MRGKRWSDVRIFPELRGLVGRGGVLALALWATAACNGDGSGSGLTLSVGFGLKQLQFAWNAFDDTDYYRLLESMDGGANFSQLGGQIAAGTTSLTIDIAVHRHDWAAARYRVEACNMSGCTASNTVNTLNGLLQTIGYMKASNTASVDGFGGAVALSSDGTTLAVGATGEDSNAAGIDGSQADNSALNAGAVYVYTRDNTGAWTQQAYVKASNAETQDGFGGAVALSSDGNTLAVGATGEDGSVPGVNVTESDNGALSAGAVYVFTRDPLGAWTQQAYVKASNPELDDRFGGAVALSSDGTTLAVGATGEDSNATGIDGTQSDSNAIDAGAVYVYTRDTNDIWTQQAYVKASNTESEDGFGGAVALSSDGNTLAVGATGEDSNATGVNTGAGDNTALEAGAVYVYTRNAGVWTQQAYVKASNTESADGFGGAVAVSGDGDTLVVGATGEDSNATGIDGAQGDNGALDAGAVYVYTRDTLGAWTQQAYVKASNTESADGFGGAVAVNSDGDTVAAGATGEDSSATGVGGTQGDNGALNAGAVHLY
ncbi:MAG: integrin [Nitrospirota bacterium]